MAGDHSSSPPPTTSNSSTTMNSPTNSLNSSSISTNSPTTSTTNSLNTPDRSPSSLLDHNCNDPQQPTFEVKIKRKSFEKRALPSKKKLRGSESEESEETASNDDTITLCNSTEAIVIESQCFDEELSELIANFKVEGYEFTSFGSKPNSSPKFKDFGFKESAGDELSDSISSAPSSVDYDSSSSTTTCTTQIKVKLPKTISTEGIYKDVQDGNVAITSCHITKDCCNFMPGYQFLFKQCVFTKDYAKSHPQNYTFYDQLLGKRYSSSNYILTDDFSANQNNNLFNKSSTVSSLHPSQKRISKGVNRYSLRLDGGRIWRTINPVKTFQIHSTSNISDKDPELSRRMACGGPRLIMKNPHRHLYEFLTKDLAVLKTFRGLARRRKEYLDICKSPLATPEEIKFIKGNYNHVQITFHSVLQHAKKRWFYQKLKEAYLE